MRTLILLGLAVLSFSQTFDENDPRAIIEKVKIYRLTKDLDLTTEQAILFFPKKNMIDQWRRLLSNSQGSQTVNLYS